MGIWSQASSLAEKTPEDRNKYVDFLRAVSILFVITGHWLIATIYYDNGQLAPGDLLDTHPWTQWLTWIFQVMPVFFVVGGYANAVSLDSARRKQQDYASWLAARLNRLVTPVLVLIIAWACLALVLRFFGVRGEVIQFGSQASLIPIWFLAIYIMVVILAPLTHRFWRKRGFLSFAMFAACAFLVDLAYFTTDMRWLGWTNYFWVWLAVHQLGYAWRDDRLGHPLFLLSCSLVGAGVLMLMIFKGPYPLAMAGSPGEGISNTLPPKATLLALGVLQFGLLLSIEKPMRRLLRGLKLWTVTVLINSMIMTIYLWHITVMIIVVALAFLAGGIGMTYEPGGAQWWLTRPVWILALYAILLPVSLLIAPLERRAIPQGARIPRAPQQIAGATMICLGIAFLATFGYGGGPFAGFDVLSFALVVCGSGVSGLLPMPWRKSR
jgi:peptidoglycan/LPS O-acetylase OafA/YrhL